MHTTTTTTPKNPMVERLHTWIDRAEQELAADRHPQGVLEDLLADLEQLATQLDNMALAGGETR